MSSLGFQPKWLMGYFENYVLGMKWLWSAIIAAKQQLGCTHDSLGVRAHCTSSGPGHLSRSHATQCTIWDEAPCWVLHAYVVGIARPYVIQNLAPVRWRLSFFLGDGSTSSSTLCDNFKALAVVSFTPRLSDCMGYFRTSSKLQPG